jgi:hypothetical protein
MAKLAKIAVVVAAGLALASCASEGSNACGTVATPVAAPAPMNACKNMSSCKHKAKHHAVKHHAAKHVAKKETKTAETTTTTN